MIGWFRKKQAKPAEAKPVELPADIRQASHEFNNEVANLQALTESLKESATRIAARGDALTALTLRTRGERL